MRIVVTQEDENDHWTPEDIHQLYRAARIMAVHAYVAALSRGDFSPGELTLGEVFAKVYTRSGTNLTVIRNADNYSDGAEGGYYAINNNGTIIVHDALFYERQRTATGATRNPQLTFTPLLMLMHEIAHQINFIYTLADGSPSTVYGTSFTQIPVDPNDPSQGIRGFRYTFQQDHVFTYIDANNTVQVARISAGDTLGETSESGDYLPLLRSSDSGYGFRARSQDKDKSGYDAAEQVTDAHVAEVADSPGVYTSYGVNSFEDELFALAREEVNEAIFDRILAQVDWPTGE